MFFVRVNGKRRDPVSTIISLVMLVLFFMLLFFVARGVFRLLTWLAPFLFIATLILDYRVVVDYGKYLYRTLNRSAFWGIVMTVLTIVGFPVVVAFLFGKALLFKRAEKTQRDLEEDQEGEYIPYEEVEEEEPEDDEFIDLPEFQKEKDRDKYKKFFDN
ncbi:MAG: hypothetical protein EA411_09385 [Saprospirales bacterium]|nr:MAG: hypothetical protein EA411_09385 [Saprospirales bacterium]